MKEPNHIWCGFEWFGIPATDWIIAIGGAATLLTLIFLYWDSQRQRQERERSEQKKLIDVLEYLKAFLENSIRPLDRQKVIIDEVIEQLGVQKVIDIKFQYITNLSIDWEIDKSLLTQAFLKYFEGDYKAKLYYLNQFIVYSKLIENIANKIEGEFYNIITISNKYEDLFNEGKTILIKEMDKVTRTVKAQNSAEAIAARNVNLDGLSPLQKDLLEVTNDWYGIQPEQERHEMFTTYNRFILAVQPVVQKYWDESLLESLRITNYAFESYKKNMLINQRKFMAYSNLMKAASKRYRVIIRKLDKSINEANKEL